MSKGKYNYSLDFIRFVGIVIVVFNHAINGIYPLGVEELGDWSTFSKLYGYTLATICRSLLPLFLYLSGYLLIPRDYSEHEQRVHFWKHNLLTLIGTWEIWIVFYNLFNAVFDPESACTFIEVIRQMLFVAHVPMPHSWYMPMIIGTYIFLPYVSMIVKKINVRELLFIMFVVYVYSCVVPSINQIIVAFDTEDGIYTQLELAFGGSYYGLFIIGGYLLYKGYRWNVSNTVKIVTVVILLAFTVYAQLYLCHDSFYVWCNFFTVPPASYLMFDLFEQASAGKYNKLVHKISQYTFGIFLIHNNFLFLLNKYITFPEFIKKPVQVIILFAVAFALSYVFVDLVARIPKAGWILFHMRPAKTKEKQKGNA